MQKRGSTHHPLVCSHIPRYIPSDFESHKFLFGPRFLPSFYASKSPPCYQLYHVDALLFRVPELCHWRGENGHRASGVHAIDLFLLISQVDVSYLGPTVSSTSRLERKVSAYVVPWFTFLDETTNVERCREKGTSLLRQIFVVLTSYK